MCECEGAEPSQASQRVVMGATPVHACCRTDVYAASVRTRVRTSAGTAAGTAAGTTSVHATLSTSGCSPLCSCEVKRWLEKQRVGAQATVQVLKAYFGGQKWEGVSFGEGEWQTATSASTSSSRRRTLLTCVRHGAEGRLAGAGEWTGTVAFWEPSCNKTSH
eukprot:2193572-Pleurochrysis_carterae.AAC.2